MSYNIAQIKDRARQAGREISEQEAQQIMNATNGGDEGLVQQYLAGGAQGGLDPAGQAILDAMNKQNEVFVSKLKEYDTTNPFVYDEILAQEMGKVGERLDPYYKQQLGDFTTAMSRKTSRSLEDRQRVLTNISLDVDQYTKENKQAVEDALEKSREGYSGAGLYTSGARMRTEGRLGAEAGKSLADYLGQKDRAVGEVNLGTQRQLEDYGEQTRLFERGVGSMQDGVFKRGADSEAEVRLQAIPEVARRQQQREFERRQYAGAPAGADQAQYYLDTYKLLS